MLSILIRLLEVVKRLLHYSNNEKATTTIVNGNVIVTISNKK